jgi:hypothetical protein
MKSAEYPQRKCRERVPGDFQDYLCPIREHHAGPCAAFEVPRSVQARDKWEEAHPSWEKMSVFDDPFAEAEKIMKGEQ